MRKSKIQTFVLKKDMGAIKQKSKSTTTLDSWQ